jgi:hypothetical protein
MTSSIQNNTAGGDWNDAGLWNGGIPDSSTADALLAAAGSYAITITNETETVDSATLDAVGATLDIESVGFLELTGSLAEFFLAAGTLDLDGGAIEGGTIDATGGYITVTTNSSVSSLTQISGTLSIAAGQTLGYVDKP